MEKSAKGTDTLLKPDISFEEFSLSDVTQDMLNFLSNDLGQGMKCCLPGEVIHSRLSARSFIRDRATKLTLIYVRGRELEGTPEILGSLWNTFLLSKLEVAIYIMSRN